MSRSLPNLPIAVFVLVTGIAALAAVGLRAEPPSVEPAPTTAPVIVDIPPATDGLDPSVRRVLYSTGLAEVLGPADTSPLPPQVARVLAAYGDGLAVPTSSGGGG